MITRRTAESLLRDSYGYSDLAQRLREAGHGKEAASIDEVASTVNKVGNLLLDKLEKRP